MEMHVSDPKQREEFRHFSFVEIASDDVVAGLGTDGYIVAVDKVAAKIT